MGGRGMGWSGVMGGRGMVVSWEAEAWGWSGVMGGRGMGWSGVMRGRGMGVEWCHER